MFQHMNYRNWLNKILEEKRRKNSKYSLRAFARDLGVQASMLSEVLSEKRRLTNEKAKLIAKSICESEIEENYFVNLVRLSDGKSSGERSSARRLIDAYYTSITGIEQLNSDNAQLFSDWKTVLLIQLLKIDSPKLSESEISDALEIDNAELIKKLNVLRNLGLLNENPYEVVEMYSEPNISLLNEPSYKKFREKLNTSIENKTALEASSSLLLTVSQEEKENLIEKLQDLMKNIERSSQIKNNNKDEVLALNLDVVSLFKKA